MNETATTIGPVALPTWLVLLLASGLIAAAVGRWTGRRTHARIGNTLFDMLIAGAVAARIGFVALWFDRYLQQPWTAFDIRDGGFVLLPGIVAAVVVAAWQAARRPALRRPLLLGLLAGAFGWLAAPGALRLGAAPALASLDPVPLPRLHGTPASLASIAAGQPMVVNLWATWCAPCRREMPVLAAAQQQSADVRFVFVNQGEDVFAVEQYLAAGQLTIVNVLLDADRTLGAKAGSMALPTTLFYDAGGRLVASHLGSLSSASLASNLQRLRASATQTARSASH